MSKLKNAYVNATLRLKQVCRVVI